MSNKIVFDDGVMQRVIERVGKSKYVSQLQQRDRGVILEHNKELRKDPNALRHASFMGLEYTIPIADLHTIRKAIRRNNPGANHAALNALFTDWLKKYGGPYKVRA